MENQRAINLIRLEAEYAKQKAEHASSGITNAYWLGKETAFKFCLCLLNAEKVAE